MPAGLSAVATYQQKLALQTCRVARKACLSSAALCSFIGPLQAPRPGHTGVGSSSRMPRGLGPGLSSVSQHYVPRPGARCRCQLGMELLDGSLARAHHVGMAGLRAFRQLHHPLQGHWPSSSFELMTANAGVRDFMAAWWLRGCRCSVVEAAAANASHPVCIHFAIRQLGLQLFRGPSSDQCSRSSKVADAEAAHPCFKRASAQPSLSGATLGKRVFVYRPYLIKAWKLDSATGSLPFIRAAHANFKWHMRVQELLGAPFSAQPSTDLGRKCGS